MNQSPFSSSAAFGWQFDWAAQLIQSLGDIQFRKWILPRRRQVIPSFRRNRLRRFEEWRRLVEVENVSRLESELGAHLERDGDLTFAGKSGFHGRKVSSKSKEIKRRKLMRHPTPNLNPIPSSQVHLPTAR